MIIYLHYQKYAALSDGNIYFYIAIPQNTPKLIKLPGSNMSSTIIHYNTPRPCD